jgi:pyruvate,water dikinase
MDGAGDRPDGAAGELGERARALRCLYRIDEILTRRDISTEELVRGVLAALPDGFTYPEICTARAQIRDRVVELPGFAVTPWRLAVPVVVQGETTGRIEVCYTAVRPQRDQGPFLDEERHLLESIAEHLGSVLARRRLRQAMGGERAGEEMPGWQVILEFLRQTDRALLGRLGRKLLNQLAWGGVEEAAALLRRATPRPDDPSLDENRPQKMAPLATDAATAAAAFRLAAERLSEGELIALVQGWIKEEKAAFLKHAIERVDTPLAELADALDRFRQGGVAEEDLSAATRTGMRASLARRFLTDQVEVVDQAKKYLRVEDFTELVQHLVYPPRSHGRVGGKAAGLFLAVKVIERSPERQAQIGTIRAPRSWYIPSDGILDFIEHNDLGEVHSRKYDDVDRVRREYPHVVQLFKSSQFSPDVLRGLSTVLDDLEGRPVIVRSSSLLEDRLGSAFSGKYKSLFLANTGTKRERLAALADAIAEIYASLFSPDPIEYRALRGFLDLHEEMGILIQEVVGRQIGPYWLPAFSGVGFSHNEFRWSPRIRREDGLLRLVPGLGTRAVDRLADDYPVLVAPGQPSLRVNPAPEDAARYSPRKIDVINLETGGFETVDLRAFLRRWGDQLPLLRRMVSIYDQDRLRKPVGAVDAERDDLVVTFEGLIADTPFVARMKALLDLLCEKLGSAVDVEFACDGEEIYLVQCRPQGATHGAQPVPIPRDAPPERVLFTARRYVSNGRVGDITHVVYVDPDAYGRLELAKLRDVGRVVGRLNRLLPRRQFVLIGPGRWGSRGDIRLGVPVTYADISHCAVLIEVARRRGGYVPDLSFGTHFFQDLVESAIRYLPLYPDDPEIVFNERFFTGSPNLLAELLPESADFAEVVRVIDVVRATGGLVLQVLMNGDTDEAMGLLAAPARPGGWSDRPGEADPAADEPWRWHQRLAERLAARLDAQRFGVRAAYLLGSPQGAAAAPAGPLDLLLHVDGDPARRHDLELWLAGWSQAIAEMSWLRTGAERGHLLHAHFVTDDEVAAGQGLAARIDAPVDPARPLRCQPSDPESGASQVT